MKNEKLIILTDSALEEGGANQKTSEPVANTAGEVLRMAIERGADTEQLERLLTLELRWRAYQAELAYQASFLAFKQEPSLKILKDELVSYTTAKGTTEYRYSPLDRCEEVIIPLLAKHGITHGWKTEPQANGWLKVTCILTHVLCHKNDDASLLGPPDTTGSKNLHQSIGSNLSYLERYTLCAACGITPRNMDTDARVPAAEPEQIEASVSANENEGNGPNLVPLLAPAVRQALEKKLRACKTMEEMGKFWEGITKEQRKAMEAVKDECKQALGAVCK